MRPSTLLVAAAALLWAACGGGSNESTIQPLAEDRSGDGPTATTGTQPTPAATVAGEKAAGQTLIAATQALAAATNTLVPPTNTSAPPTATTAAKPTNTSVPPTPVPPTATPKPQPACDPNYTGACVPPYPPDVNCPQIPVKNFRSIGSDPHRLDADHDGIACEG